MIKEEIRQAIALLQEHGYQITAPREIVIVPKDETPTFEEWWDAYQKKRGRKKAEAKWNKLKPTQKLACMKATPAYVMSTPDVQYRKDPMTYLNGECWNDEIISKREKTDNGTINKLNAIFAE
jgi:hypothetical protein